MDTIAHFTVRHLLARVSHPLFDRHAITHEIYNPFSPALSSSVKSCKPLYLLKYPLAVQFQKAYIFELQNAVSYIV